jgi:hypothetical protein
MLPGNTEGIFGGSKERDDFSEIYSDRNSPRLSCGNGSVASRCGSVKLAPAIALLGENTTQNSCAGGSAIPASSVWRPRSLFQSVAASNVQQTSTAVSYQKPRQ